MSPRNFSKWTPSNILRAQIEAGPSSPLLWRPRPPFWDDQRWGPLIDDILRDQPHASPDPWFWLNPLQDPDLEENLREAAEVLKGERTKRAGEQAAELVRQIPLFGRIRPHFYNANLANHVDVWELLQGECEDMFSSGVTRLTPRSALTLLARSETGGAASQMDWRAWMAVAAWTCTALRPKRWGGLPPKEVAMSYEEQARRGGCHNLLEHIFVKKSSWDLSGQPKNLRQYAEGAEKVGRVLKELGLEVSGPSVRSALAKYVVRQG